MSQSESLLIRISGPDQRGITAGVMDILSQARAELQDVEQTIIRGRLSLGVIASIPPEIDVRPELLMLGYERDVNIDFLTVPSSSTGRKPGLVATIVGQKVDPAELGAIAAVVTTQGGNIERIVRIARYPVMAYELVICASEIEKVRTSLLEAARNLMCDVAVHRENLGRRAARLVVLDVDSTLIQDEMIELIANEAGRREQVAKITDRAMRGEIDFTQSLNERVQLLAGLDYSAVEKVKDLVRLTPGARTFIRTLKRLGYRTATVSGGFNAINDALAADLGIDHAYANELEIVDGKLTGQVLGKVVDRARKAELLHEIAAFEGVPVDQVVAVGDGANDLDMLNAAGLGVAFNAKPVVRQAADTSVNVPYLDAVLFVLGIKRSEIEAADEAEGIPPGPPVS